MQSTRRAFLMGRRTPETPWAAFCRRLARACEDRFEDRSRNGLGRAWLFPAEAAQVRLARALCAEYGVTLVLAGAAPADPMAPAVLTVDPAPGLHGLTSLPGGHTWRVEPGCPLSRLRALPCGAIFPSGQDTLTAAAWLAGVGVGVGTGDDDSDGTGTGTGTGDGTGTGTGTSDGGSNGDGTGASHGLVALDVMLADGTCDRLGPFGAGDSQPLRSAALQLLVPALFELAAGPVGGAAAKYGALARPCVHPSRYRLDALSGRNGSAINLAHLLAGHGGSLAWVEYLYFEVPTAVAAPSVATHHDASCTAQEDGEAIEAQVKALFDPHGLFASLPAR